VIDSSWYVRPTNVPARTAAGGVVTRVSEGHVLVALVREGEYPDYILPKGRLEPGEDVEEAARREIGEEAGLHDLRLLGPLGARERLSFDRRWWVTTHYFLFRTSQTDGHPTDRQHSYRLEWFPADQLPRLFWPEQAELVRSCSDAIAGAAAETVASPSALPGD
jgi:ADP-ribose pyrophosphatase YjhB (NUDIX family)